MLCNVTRAMLYWLMIGIASVAVSGHRTVVTFENDDVFNSLTPNGFGLHAEGTVNITIKVFSLYPSRFGRTPSLFEKTLRTRRRQLLRMPNSSW